MYVSHAAVTIVPPHLLGCCLTVNPVDEEGWAMLDRGLETWGPRPGLPFTLCGLGLALYLPLAPGFLTYKVSVLNWISCSHSDGATVAPSAGGQGAAQDLLYPYLLPHPDCKPLVCLFKAVTASVPQGSRWAGRGRAWSHGIRWCGRSFLPYRPLRGGNMKQIEQKVAAAIRRGQRRVLGLEN